jgi:phosphomevalonate kinase
MKVFAPGKLVLTGAYAVLNGAPAIAIAVSRGATADATRKTSSATPEVRAALGSVAAPHVDASPMFDGARKLGLGASAAILVASLGALDAVEGTDPTEPSARERLFARALLAHRKAQSGGSGVDVAASAYGGTIRYVMDESPRRVALPGGLVVAAFACPTSASTPELRAKVDGLPRTRLGELVAIAREAADAVDAQDTAGFVILLRRTARALDRLGVAAGAAIVPAGFDALEDAAAREAASFSVAGAGGGDVAVFVGPAAPSKTFLERAGALGLASLGLSLDHKGVRTLPGVSAFADSSCVS